MIPFNYLKCDFIEEQLFQYKFFYFYIIAHSSRILQRRPTPKRKNGFTENNFHGESIDNNIYTIYRSVFPYGILLGSKPCTRIQKLIVLLCVDRRVKVALREKLCDLLSFLKVLLKSLFQCCKLIQVFCLFSNLQCIREGKKDLVPCED